MAQIQLLILISMILDENDETKLSIQKKKRNIEKAVRKKENVENSLCKRVTYWLSK